MPVDDRDDSDNENQRHPALRNFSRTGFMFQHAIGKTLKWAAVGAVVGAGLIGLAMVASVVSMGWLALPTGVIATFLAKIPVVGAIVPWAATSLGSTALSLALGGGAIAAAGGGLLGAIFSISGASEAADQEEERLIAVYERREARQQRMAMLQQQRDQQHMAMMNQEQQLGLRPNAPLMGRGGRGAGMEQTT